KTSLTALSGIFQRVHRQGSHHNGGQEELENRLVGQILVNSQIMVSTSFLLHKKLKEKSNKFLQHFTQFILTFLIVLVLLAVIISIWVYTSIMPSIAKLEKGTKILGAGNLDYESGLTSQDEIGDLARSFDAMAKKLKDVTASRDELDREIAERKKAEESLLRLASIVENSNDAIIGETLDGTIVSWNEGAKKIFGYRTEEVVDKPVSILMPPELPDELPQHLDEVRKGKKVIPFETTRLRKNGERVHVLLTISPIKDADGNIIEASTIATDITNKKEAEKSLKEKDACFRSLIEQAGDSIYLISLDGKIIDANENGLHALGYERDELMQMCVWDIGSTSSQEEEFDNLYQKLAPHSPVTVEATHCRKDGTGFPVELRIGLVELGGQPQILILATEIGARKKREEMLLRAREAAEAADRAKSDFLANMSHELRTPLNAIIGFSQLLEEQAFGELNEKQLRYAHNIQVSGMHLLSLINDILDLAKIEAGKLELEPSKVKIASLLENSLVMIRQKALNHGVHLDCCIPQELTNLEIIADERKLKQIAYNLLSNAIKFTPDGGTITLKVWQDKEKLFVSIIDTGIGIRPEDQECIFGKFEQVDSSYARLQEGTGLGLALTKNLVELHQGNIWLVSQGEGFGSTFTFMLPLHMKFAKLDGEEEAAEISES
ncbi:MAG: PAS domain S-box protein, partial [Desulfobulbaceae bacterium]|nr:PAS domain S-box protein [Desulfobulbaceae bacterium]